MMRESNVVVAGIDVGGARKGFHGVALVNGRYLAQQASLDAEQMAAWCKEIGAIAVGVDAPARWSQTGRMRPAERELARSGISCFATPRLETALSHPFYAWMLQGAALYRALERDYPRYDGTQAVGTRTCFETFPQAIACALAGTAVSAKNKGPIRRALLAQAGIDPAVLGSIDMVDAALCALAAYRLQLGEVSCFGEAGSGFIVIPVLEMAATR
jgi:predicted nuclease with RNAse H fold